MGGQRVDSRVMRILSSGSSRCTSLPSPRFWFCYSFLPTILNMTPAPPPPPPHLDFPPLFDQKKRTDSVFYFCSLTLVEKLFMTDGTRRLCRFGEKIALVRPARRVCEGGERGRLSPTCRSVLASPSTKSSDSIRSPAVLFNSQMPL